MGEWKNIYGEKHSSLQNDLAEAWRVRDELREQGGTGMESHEPRRYERVYDPTNRTDWNALLKVDIFGYIIKLVILLAILINLETIWNIGIATLTLAVTFPIFGIPVLLLLCILVALIILILK